VNKAEVPDVVAACLRRALDHGVDVLTVTGHEDAAPTAEWYHDKYRPPDPDDLCGLLPLDVTYNVGGQTVSRRLLMKSRTHTGVGSGLIPSIIERSGLRFDRPYPDYRTVAETRFGGPQEIGVYRRQAEHESLERSLPRYFGDHVYEARDEYVLLMEFVADTRLMNRGDDLAGWDASAIDAALTAVGAIHADWYGADDELAAPDWLVPRPTTADVVADEPLWSGYVDASHAEFPSVVTADVWRGRHELIDAIPDWHPVRDELPQTLVHNDFNPRNVCFRGDGRPLIYDWELAMADVAQRDLVEMLTFSLMPDVDRVTADAHVEAHRRALEASLGAPIDVDEWLEGFRCMVRYEAISRIGMQLLFATQLDLPYVPRVSATVDRLVRLYG